VKKVIDEWDPIEVFPYAPDDEYETEVKLICDAIKKIDFNNDMESQLAREIQNIFKKQLDSEIFDFNYEKCLSIAQKIMGKI